MKTYKSQLVGAAGTFALLAGLLSAAVAAPKAPAPKMATPKMSTKMSSHTATHKMSSTKMAAKKSQVTGTITHIKGSTVTMKPTMSKNGASKTVAIPSSAKVWIGGKTGRLSSLKTGQKITVMMSGSKITGVSAAAASSKMHKTSMKKPAAHEAAAHKTATAKPATHKAHV